MNGEAQPQTYRFIELTREHQVALLRQQILQTEQALYTNSITVEALLARRGQLLDDLNRLHGAVRALVAPAPAEEPRPGAPEVPQIEEAQP